MVTEKVTGRKDPIEKSLLSLNFMTISLKYAQNLLSLSQSMFGDRDFRLIDPTLFKKPWL